MSSTEMRLSILKNYSSAKAAGHNSYLLNKGPFSSTHSNYPRAALSLGSMGLQSPLCAIEEGDSGDGVARGEDEELAEEELASESSGGQISIDDDVSDIGDGRELNAEREVGCQD